MPKPNLNNPICPVCQRHTTYNGKQLSGANQYRCRRHKPNYTYTDSDRKHGSIPLGEQAMSQVERNRKYRRNKKRRKTA